MKFLGTGSALPKKVVSNDDLAQVMDTSDEWIRSRTGIGIKFHSGIFPGNGIHALGIHLIVQIL